MSYVLVSRQAIIFNKSTIAEMLYNRQSQTNWVPAMNDAHFDIALKILEYINSEKGSFEALTESLGMDDITLTLWLKTLMGVGYLKKEKLDSYSITQEGLMKLRYHSHR